MKRFAMCAVLSLTSFASFAQAQEMPAAYKQVLDTLGKTGDFKDNVLKVNIPRNDLSITVANVKTPTPFGFGGWVAMTKGTGGMDVMMGDLVLTQDEVNPGDVGAARERPRSDRAAQPFLLGRAAHVLHARPWARHAGGSGAQGEAGPRSDWQGRPRRGTGGSSWRTGADARDRHGEDGADRRAIRARRTARSTRSRSAATISS